MSKKIQIDEAELKARLDPLSYDVLRNAATENAEGTNFLARPDETGELDE